VLIAPGVSTLELDQVAEAEIDSFEDQLVLSVTRFDRFWTRTVACCACRRRISVRRWRRLPPANTSVMAVPAFCPF